MIRKLFHQAVKVFWLLPGFLLWASFPPMGETTDCLFALAPLLWLSRNADVKTNVRRWFLNGFLFWFATLSWMPAIVKNGGPWPLVVLGWGALAAYCSLYFAAFGYLSAKYWAWARDTGTSLSTNFTNGHEFSRGGYGKRLLGLLVVEPVLWAGLEIVRSRFLGGFAWNQLGVAPVNCGFGAPAALGGVYLISALVILVNGTLTSIAERMLAPYFAARRRQIEIGGQTIDAAPQAPAFVVPNWLRSVETLLPFLVILGLYQLSQSRITPPEPRTTSHEPRATSHEPRATSHEPRTTPPEPRTTPPEPRTTNHEPRTTTLSVALVQRNFPCCFQAREEEPLAIYSNLFEKVALLKPDLVVLPESAMAEFGALDRANAVRFARYAHARTDAALLAGGGRYAGDKTYNSAALYTTQDPSAPLAFADPQVYDKVHLVPFGEFIPGDKLIPALQKLAPVGSCTPGELKLLTLEKGCGEDIRLGVAICFEDTDSAQMRALARMGAQVLVFITNDSWFSHSIEALQHAWQARARAIETGLPVVRVGNSGVTGTVQSDGRATWLVDARGKPLVDERGTMSDRISVAETGDGVRRTLYVRFGDAPLGIAFALLMLGMILVKYKNYAKRRFVSV